MGPVEQQRVAMAGVPNRQKGWGQGAGKFGGLVSAAFSIGGGADDPLSPRLGPVSGMKAVKAARASRREDRM